MNKIFNIIKDKKVIIVLITFMFILFIGMWSVVSGGYDKQNKIILFLKEFIPTDVARKVRDTILVSAEITEDAAKETAILSKKIGIHIEGKEIKKTIYVPGKLVNIVAL